MIEDIFSKISTNEEILNSLISDEGNLLLKTSLPNTVSIVRLITLSDYCKRHSYYKTSEAIMNYVNTFIQAQFSDNGLSREQIVKVLSHQKEKEIEKDEENIIRKWLDL